MFHKILHLDWLHLGHGWPHSTARSFLMLDLPWPCETSGGIAAVAFIVVSRISIQWIIVLEVTAFKCVVCIYIYTYYGKILNENKAARHFHAHSETTRSIEGPWCCPLMSCRYDAILSLASQNSVPLTSPNHTSAANWRQWIQNSIDSLRMLLSIWPKHIVESAGKSLKPTGNGKQKSRDQLRTPATLSASRQVPAGTAKSSAKMVDGPFWKLTYN